MKDTFPELLHGEPAPEDPRIWELSRFAIETEGQQSFGFSSIATAKKTTPEPVLLRDGNCMRKINCIRRRVTNTLLMQPG